MEQAEERALRRELEALARKREQLDAPTRGNVPVADADKRRGVFARLGGVGSSRQAHLKENSVRGNGPRRLGKRADDDRFDTRDGSAVKRQRLSSAVARPHPNRARDDCSDEERRGRAEESAPAGANAAGAGPRGLQRKQRAVEPYAQKDGIARSRRMFGALMGHLGKAKQRIEKDTDLFKRQGSRQQEAELKEKAQAESLATRARRNATVAKLEALIARTELEQSEQRARAKLEHLQTMRKSAGQSKFLVTVASPPIYYRPAKHTKETEDLVAASMEAHEAKTRSSTRDHEAKLRKLETEFRVKLEELRVELEDAKKDGEKSENKDVKEEAAVGGTAVKQEQRTEGGRSVTKGEGRHAEDQDEEMAVPSVKEEEEAETLSSSVKEEDKQQLRAKPSRRSHQQQQDEASSAGMEDEEAAEVATADDPSLHAATLEVEKDKSSSPKIRARSMRAKALDLSKMRVTDLRKELKQRGLDNRGLKAELLQRLEAALHEQEDDN